jgi:hypothetical protein
MLFQHQSRDRQPEAVTSGRAVARTVEAGKGREDTFAFISRYADAVVVDMHLDLVIDTSALTRIRVRAYLMALRSRLVIA